ncbi:acetylcholine receptor subunit beta-like [Lineus longissimus]|uniref:acetylcholine receptor subunit beta-like n=1 Tax=Lineus longissimus TaxID=88925 RepID=UPI002B4D35F3
MEMLRRRMKFIAVLFLMTINDFGMCADVTLSSEAKVIRLLTSNPNYDKRVRPIKNSSNPIFVSLSLLPRSLISLDDEKQRIAIAAYFDLRWKDEYMHWDPAQYDGVKRIVLTNQDIWIPDIITIDSQGGMDDVAYTIVGVDLVVTYDGNVTWYSNRVFVRSCSLKMTYFPFDVQECYFRFESRTHNRPSLTMFAHQHPAQIESLDISELHKYHDGQWDFVKGDAAVFVEVYLDWSYYRANLTMKRKPIYFILNILGPCVVISLLIPIMFYLPPDSGEKISMGVTILLAFSVFQMVLAESLPHNSDTTPIIVIYITVLMASSALSIILAVIVLQLHLRGDVMMPRWLRFLVFDCLARVVCMHESAQRKIKMVEGTEIIFENGRFPSTKMDFDDKNGVQLESVNKNWSTKPRNTDDVLLSVLNQTNRPTDQFSTRPENGNVELYLSKIVDSLNNSFGVQNEARRKSELSYLWKEMARVLDRVFMLCYFIINIVAAATFVGLFLQNPNK